MPRNAVVLSSAFLHILAAFAITDGDAESASSLNHRSPHIDPFPARKSSNFSATDIPPRREAQEIPEWALNHFWEDEAISHSRPSLNQNCDLYRGKWVYDATYPLWDDYLSPFYNLEGNCQIAGRKDSDYLKLRWQPHQCSIPRFDAKDFRARLANRRIVYVGDSIGRHGFYSMVGMLAQGLDHSRILKQMMPTNVRRRRKATHSYYFQEFNFTVEYYRSSNLGDESRPPPGVYPDQVKRILRLDLVSPVWAEPCVGADIIVFSGGHWFNDQHVLKFGTYPMLNEKFYESNFDWAAGFEAAIVAWSRWADQQQQRGSQVFFRGYSPGHARVPRPCPSPHPTWHPTPVPEEEKVAVVKRVIAGMMSPAGFLDVTTMSTYRNDAHIGSRSPDSRPDCSHWCVPGLPDSWNALLYAELMVRGRPPFDNPPGGRAQP